MQMSMEEINNLRSLLAKATPGPWEVRYSPRTTEECIVVGPRPETMGYAPCILAEDYTGFGEWPVREADHLLVAAMRNALPALLDLAERASLPLAGDVERLCARLGATRDGVPFGWASSDGRSDIRTPKHLINPDGPEAVALIRSLAGRVEAEKRATGWRCFQCDKTFFTHDEAERHFGRWPGNPPVCSDPLAPEVTTWIDRYNQCERRNEELCAQAEREHARANAAETALTAEKRAKEEAERERDSWKAVCRKAGVCMSCAIAMPDPHGCFDCLNTGWEGGAPKGSAPEKIVTPLHSDGEPLSMEGAIAANRPCATHCTVCEGEEHHWLDECADEGDPIQVCKHCNAWRPFGDDADD